VESLDIDAQGVAHKPDGKVVFIEGALPFEWSAPTSTATRTTGSRARSPRFTAQSSQRVQPGCPHFGLHEGACGGCKMQHLHVGAQVAVKQRVLEDNLWHLGKVKAGNSSASDRGAGLGLPLPGPPVGAPCAQEGRGAGGFS
jgi:23S rRNA (uracil1939-C5)-methyltransferase